LKTKVDPPRTRGILCFLLEHEPVLPNLLQSVGKPQGGRLPTLDAGTSPSVRVDALTSTGEWLFKRKACGKVRGGKGAVADPSRVQVKWIDGGDAVRLASRAW